MLTADLAFSALSVSAKTNDVTIHVLRPALEREGRLSFLKAKTLPPSFTKNRSFIIPSGECYNKNICMKRISLFP